MQYKITFIDGVVYTSPDIRSKDPGWETERKVKNIAIKNLTILLPNNQTLLLVNFEKYNFFVEATQIFGGIQGANINAFFFCGAWQNHVVIWEINFRTKQVLKRVAKEGEEYNGTATRGWRKGLIGEKAESGLCHLNNRLEYKS